MARQIDTDDPGTTDPMYPGSTPTPPTQPGTKIAFQVTGTSTTITADQIMSAGGPWAKFTVRVTPLNANGAGQSSDAASVPLNFRVTDTGDLRTTQDGMTRIGE